MITPPQIRSLLDGLARKFDARPLTEYEVKGNRAEGWGQFLDSQPEHNQIGPFGTCSGIIARALASRGADILDDHVNNLIKHWWSERDDPNSHAKFLGQTIRLAMLHLALRIRNSDAMSVVTSEVRARLLGASRPDGMWGNYVMPHDIEDPSPRLVATSLAILSFTLFQQNDKNDLPKQVITAVEYLEDRMQGSEDLPRLHVAIAAAAILSIPERTPTRKARRRIEQLAYAMQISLPDLGVYFYDYEFIDSPKSATQATVGADINTTAAHDAVAGKSTSNPQKSKTDYFIVPTELVMGIAGYMPHAPVVLRLRAESTIKLLVKNLRGYDGYYRPDPEQRISSVNQSWVAMYLALAERALAKPNTSQLSGMHRWTSRVWYELLKQRPDKQWLDTLMFVGGSFLVVGANWAMSSDTGWRSLTVKLLSCVWAFIAGRLYAPTTLKRVFVERP
jgi:hypothetical protein